MSCGGGNIKYNAVNIISSDSDAMALAYVFNNNDGVVLTMTAFLIMVIMTMVMAKRSNVWRSQNVACKRVTARRRQTKSQL